MSDVQYRWINGLEATQEEWDGIDMILAARGWMSWNRETTRVLVAEDDKGLVGFLPIQLIPHTEPLYVRPDKRGTEVAERLTTEMVTYLISSRCRGWLAVADNPFVKQFCEKNGMRKLESPVYTTEVGES